MGKQIQNPNKYIYEETKEKNKIYINLKVKIKS